MQKQAPISEEDLVERLKAGDHAAVCLLYNNYSHVLYGVILRIVRCEQSAEDLLQDCFLKIWRSVNSYDPFKAKLFSWLISIARNIAIDAVRCAHYRSSQRTHQLEKEWTESSRLSTTFYPEHIGMRQITCILSSEQKEIVDLLYFGGFTQTEAAEALNIPLGTAKTRARSALAQLRKAFNTPGV